MSAAAWDDGMTNPNNEIESLRARIAELETSLRMKSVVAIGLQNRADELTRRAEKAEAALTKQRYELAEEVERLTEALAHWKHIAEDASNLRAEKAETALTEARERLAEAQSDAEKWRKDSILMLGFVDVLEEHGLIPPSSELLEARDRAIAKSREQGFRAGLEQGRKEAYNG